MALQWRWSVSAVTTLKLREGGTRKGTILSLVRAFPQRLFRLLAAGNGEFSFIRTQFGRKHLILDIAYLSA